MDKTNALKLRQSLGEVIRKLKSTGRPILVEKGREPVAVLITIEDYKKRFVDQTSDEQRNKIVEAIKSARIRLPHGLTSLDIIREIRS